VDPIPVPSIPVFDPKIEALAYSESDRILEITYKSGQVWQLFGVPPSIYGELRDTTLTSFVKFIAQRYKAAPVKTGLKTIKVPASEKCPKCGRWARVFSEVKRRYFSHSADSARTNSNAPFLSRTSARIAANRISDALGWHRSALASMIHFSAQTFVQFPQRYLVGIPRQNFPGLFITAPTPTVMFMRNDQFRVIHLNSKAEFRNDVNAFRPRSGRECRAGN